MQYDDLTPYAYDHDPAGAPGLLNAGWLDVGHPFREGEPTQVFLDRLWLYCRRPVVRHRGLHRCPFCNGSGVSRHRYPVSVPGGAAWRKDSLQLGGSEIWVYGWSDGAFAAPDLIFHYVSHHAYAPSPDFVKAALEGPMPGTAAFRERVRRFEPLRVNELDFEDGVIGRETRDARRKALFGAGVPGPC